MKFIMLINGKMPTTVTTVGIFTCISVINTLSVSLKAKQSLPPKPKSSFRHLKRGIQDFHMNYVLVPADKTANNVVVV